MNKNKYLMALAFFVFSSHVLAYGSGGGSKKSCSKPKFTQLTPAHLTEVAPQSEFSFHTGSSTNPDTLVASVKKQSVDLTIKKINSGFIVSGTLPASLQNTFARVLIQAKGNNNCNGQEGWLLKIVSP